jgi:hypothetical protein
MFPAESLLTLKHYERALKLVRPVRRLDPDNWEALALEARTRMAESGVAGEAARRLPGTVV